MLRFVHHDNDKSTVWWKPVRSVWLNRGVRPLNPGLLRREVYPKRNTRSRRLVEFNDSSVTVKRAK